MSIFEYSATKTFTSVLEVEDIGNCAICANGYYPVGKGLKFPGDYYMIVRSVDGITTIIKWGAVTDLPNLVSGYSLDVKQFKYKESSINREIQLFLNDGQKFIYEAHVIDEDEALKFAPKDSNYVATLDRT